ncbi:YbhB/YbcL family Raf kinase inhibitor-like protein [uncultured Methanolobus sp.]|uniref:YbhB/YbcL family Raf kinase inhibitor-like protein n=1 Tax=uncultured Methanolobus sp. TaxID=218300 RepID=UPI002AAA955F|nr:YbhB/YbcL family Raf kinase inhibitor-like protein [uncultured Methanolobus sp.]
MKLSYSGGTMCHQRVKSIVILALIVFLFLSLSGCMESDDGMEENTDISSGDITGNDDNPTAGPEDDTMLSGTLTLMSPAFENTESIPAKYTCDGENINPELEIADIPAEAVSLLLIMDDPDAPMGTFTHWVVWNIPADMQIDENSTPGIEGNNSAGQASYTGPCPPSGTHRYFFKVYALDTELDLESGAERSLVENTMDGHILAYGELMGTYGRS